MIPIFDEEHLHFTRLRFTLAAVLRVDHGVRSVEKAARLRRGGVGNAVAAAPSGELEQPITAHVLLLQVERS